MHSLTFPRSGDLGTWQDWEQSDTSQHRPHCTTSTALPRLSQLRPAYAKRGNQACWNLPGEGKYGNYLQDPGSWCIRTSWPSSQRPEKLGMFQQGPVSTSSRSGRDSDFRRARRARVPALDLSDSEMGGSRRNYRRGTPTRTLHHTWGTR